MRILGLSFMYHDSAAALVRDGEVVAAAAEERFSRKKHSLDFPDQAIAYCLSEGGMDAQDLDAVVFYEKPLLKFERIMTMHVRAFPGGFDQFRHAMPLWFKWKLFIPQWIRDKLGYRKRILFADHHYAHAASSFFASGFEQAAIMTTDGVGEWATLTRGRGDGNRIHLEDEIRYPHSLGLLYSAVTAFLGFEVNEGEGKVMGLASYGEPRLFSDMMKEIIDVREDGSFRLNMDYFSYHRDVVMYGPRFIERFGPPRAPEAAITRRDEDLAASLQKVVEEVCIRIARGLHDRTRPPNICVAGGVGLNSIMNRKLLQHTDFRNIFIQPAAGDDGGALGAALFAYHQYFGHDRRWSMKNAYLGPASRSQDIRRYLEARKIAYRHYPDFPELARRVAGDLQRGRIVGWYQGRMEFGPRALGNRSILANPTLPDMKDILNKRVKHREGFRPFAPSVLLEHCGDYFDLDVESPYMLLVADVRPDKRSRVPAVTHIDGTARVQTVTKGQNPRFHELIEKFYDLSGVPMVLNTSFNVRGEPIVCDHHDATECFLNCGMDALVLGDYYVSKRAAETAAGHPQG
ncbi:MAG: carbamoyltransferase [Elusimicrobia bacterium]|nr:carbamoyltransferase [Elusimicrobiota bacterium]